VQAYSSTCEYAYESDSEWCVQGNSEHLESHKVMMSIHQKIIRGTHIDPSGRNEESLVTADEP
jgi:hypothetical protein